jgi:hypothetical protein
MKCFVIMPYASEFDDVHMAIENAVCSVREPCAIACLRLDDDQRGGRIIGRLEQELRDCDMCVADLSGGRCNVMWEVGFAMALRKPVILVSHGEIDLHFDLHDVQHFKYQRTQLRRTLTEPLRNAVQHTAQHLSSMPRSTTSPIESGSVEVLRSEVHELKAMVSQIMCHVAPPPSYERKRIYYEKVDHSHELAGAWCSTGTGSCIYARFINGELVAPYCFGGDSELTGVYHGLRQFGEFLHARYEWLHAPISGFSLFRREASDRFVGAWWLDDEVEGASAETVTLESGARATWTRMKNAKTPRWAADFHLLAERLGLDGAIQQARKRP